MTHFDYDIFIIGSGEAGSTAAAMCSKAGKKVAIADNNPLGGTCSLRGCNPKRTLANAAELIQRSQSMQGKGIDGKLSINWNELIRFKDSLTKDIPAFHEKTFQSNGIDIFHGFATFSGCNEISISNKKISAQHILIATGAKPRTLKIPGDHHLIDSEELLSLKELPSRILLIGAGYISMELSHILVRAGCTVTVLEATSSILASFDQELVGMLVRETKNLGITIFPNTRVSAINKTSQGFTIKTDGETPASFTSDLIVHGAGRIPNVEELNLENGDINHLNHKITVNSFLQSISNPSVYVAGDAHSGGIQLSPVAEMEGKIAARNILFGNKFTPDYSVIPSVVFTFPSLASVGVQHSSTVSSPNNGIIFEDTSYKHISKRLGLNCSAFKIIYDKSNDRIQGMHMLGFNVDEVINLFGLLIRTGITIKDLQNFIWTFPSVTYDTTFRVS